jgi:hypothetical protein
MVLFENGIIKLDYFPASDILEVAYPDLHDFMLPEVLNSMDILVGNIVNFDVKRVLLDSSLTVVAVSDEKSRRITAHLVAGLMRTRLQKLARVQSASPVVEAIAQGNIKHVRDTYALPFELQNFSCKSEAVEWLKGSSQTEVALKR